MNGKIRNDKKKNFPLRLENLVGLRKVWLIDRVDKDVFKLKHLSKLTLENVTVKTGDWKNMIPQSLEYLSIINVKMSENDNIMEIFSPKRNLKLKKLSIKQSQISCPRSIVKKFSKLELVIDGIVLTNKNHSIALGNLINSVGQNLDQIAFINVNEINRTWWNTMTNTNVTKLTLQEVKFGKDKESVIDFGGVCKLKEIKVKNCPFINVYVVNCKIIVSGCSREDAAKWEEKREHYKQGGCELSISLNNE
jgi:hypothetical protein